ncbi:MAG: outer membrane protein assembly factor BamD [Natronospirillum sp.]
MFQRLFSVTLLASLLFITGCSLFGPQTRITTEADSYVLAQDFLQRGNYTLAIEQLERMESRYPFGAYSTQVQLDLIYAHYESNQFDVALRRTNRFIRLQPAHPEVDYVYYMRGLISFARAERTASLLGTRNPVDRDVSGYDQTFSQLQEFTARFPNSDYKAQAKGLMQVSRSRMAEHSLNVAIYYYQIDQPDAARTRLDKLLSQFPGEPVQEDALALLARVYQQQNDAESARQAIAVLQAEFPDTAKVRNDELIADYRFRRPWYFWLTLGLVG